MNSEKTHTSSASIFKDENAVIHIVINEDTRIDYFDALDHYLIIKNLSAEGPVLKLIDGRCTWSIQSKARKFLAGKEAKEKIIARAIVQDSFLKKALINFFNKLYKPVVPMRMFTDYDEAYAWLMEMKRVKSKQ